MAATLNDSDIRGSLHRKVLRKHHARDNTLVVDELGLNHGRCRADVAVINGHLIGFEIKSDEDTLARLEEQISAYDATFDRSTAVVGCRHVGKAKVMLPPWWGIMLARRGPRGAVRFERIRHATRNDSVDPFSVARLLWRDEAEAILAGGDVPRKVLRQPRAVLYKELVKMLPLRELRKQVRDCLLNRKKWRRLQSPSPSGGLCRHIAT